jgi:membrane protein
MKRIFKYEYYKLFHSYSWVYAILICIVAACITNYVIAGAPQSSYVYGVAFEYFIPQLILAAIPIFIASGLRGGKIKIELLSGEKRYKLFIAKTLVYYFTQFIVVNIYLLVLTFLNIKGVGQATINGENSFVYFLRSASIGMTYCFMLSTVLLFVSVLFRNPIVTIIADIILIVIEFVLKSTVDWRVADKVVPSLIIEQMIKKTNDKLVILSFTLMIVVISVSFYISSLLAYCKRDYK